MISTFGAAAPRLTCNWKWQANNLSYPHNNKTEEDSIKGLWDNSANPILDPDNMFSFSHSANNAITWIFMFIWAIISTFTSLLVFVVYERVVSEPFVMTLLTSGQCKIREHIEVGSYYLKRIKLLLIKVSWAGTTTYKDPWLYNWCCLSLWNRLLQ